jgi:hypothetical protein
VQITEDVGSGEYKCNKVKRSASAWVVASGDKFNNGDINCFELNAVEGIEVGTVVEIYALYDNGTVFWAFGATGGGAGDYEGPFAVQENTSSSVKFYATASAATPDIVSVGNVSTSITGSFNESLTPPGSGTETWYAWLRVSLSSVSTISVNRELTNTVPTFSNDYNTIILASITVDPTGITAIRQDHRAHVRVGVTITEYNETTGELSYNPQSTHDTEITTAEECTP